MSFLGILTFIVIPGVAAFIYNHRDDKEALEHFGIYDSNLALRILAIFFTSGVISIALLPIIYQCF